MEEVTQLVQAKVDATVSSLSQSASVSWDRATHGIRQTGHEVFAPLLERGQARSPTAVWRAEHRALRMTRPLLCCRSSGLPHRPTTQRQRKLRCSVLEVRTTHTESCGTRAPGVVPHLSHTSL